MSSCSQDVEIAGGEGAVSRGGGNAAGRAGGGGEAAGRAGGGGAAAAGGGEAAGRAGGGGEAAGRAGGGGEAAGSHSTPSQVGEPCISPDELDPHFSGFSSEETNVADVAGSDVLVCLYNRFHGRVSCPYGQTAEDIAMLPSDSPRRCRVPDAAGNPSAVPVEVPVEPQFVDRPADEAAHYSCRCDGAGPGPYCECPSSMVCTALIWDLAPAPDPSSPYAGAYCVKQGYDPEAPLGATCDGSSTDPATDCGNDRANP
ncbi:MAG TPA: hypothetical protein VER33_19990 [Polyangiaceae bacterium]|nr:hypothetical protein [Polyangiaceae bacterium]